MTPAPGRITWAGAAALILALAVPTGNLWAQSDAGRMASACEAAGTAGALLCARAASAGQVLGGHVGLLAGLGSEVPGSASALGVRFDGGPRLALHVRAGVAGISLPDPADPELPGGEATFSVPTLHAGAAIGLFDGFRPLPALGGFLAVDLIAQASVVLLPSGSGFGGGVESFSWGVRLGLVKESFTLPGIAISALRRSPRMASLGSVAEGDSYEVSAEPTVTSVRGTIGKDALSVGLLAGLGWDSYGGDLLIRAGDAVAVTDAFEAGRMLYFLGASWNLLVLQVSVEGGWAAGMDTPAAYAGRPSDPSAGTYFGSVALRLTP